ncbi:MAG: metallophosphoesterase [Bacteroidetes bacterium]|nr:metallophosphoesterase [Bacteroidota bacterium]
MRIIHLSDLHLSKDNLSSLKQFYLTALLKDLNNWQKEKSIDLVVLTGDLIDKGGSSFKDGEDVYGIVEKDFITPILQTLKLDKTRFLFIPGNHDVIESKIEDLIEDGMINNKFDNIDRINKYLDDYKTTIHSGIERISAFSEFEKKFYAGNSDCYLTNFESCFVVGIDGERVGIGAFNSAWRCSSKLPSDKLLFGTKQVLNANDYFKSKGTTLNIALIHHPIEHISEVDKNELNSFLHTNKFHILLCGHTHRGDNVLHLAQEINSLLLLLKQHLAIQEKALIHLRQAIQF